VKKGNNGSSIERREHYYSVMNMLGDEVKDRAAAQLAWEAAWERLREALRPPPGYPTPSGSEIGAAFANASERLHVLRATYIDTLTGDSEKSQEES
jgi:hypothetical protein